MHPLQELCHFGQLPMDLLGDFLPSKGEESEGGSDECAAAGPPTPPYPSQ